MPSYRSLASALVLAFATAACGASPAAPARTAGAVEVVPVPADRVVQRCPSDDDEDEAPAPRGVEYVRLEDWQAPPSVAHLESQLPPRGAEPPAYTQFPRLTLHQSIPSTSFRATRYWRTAR